MPGNPLGFMNIVFMTQENGSGRRLKRSGHLLEKELLKMPDCWLPNRLEELDSDLALFSLQLLLRPTLFKPPDKHVEFAKWNRPVLEVEGDMIGGVNSVGAHFQIQKGVENVGYTEIFKDVVVVDGCEVKLNWKGMACSYYQAYLI